MVYKVEGDYFIDSCAFDPKYNPEDEAAARILAHCERGTINLRIAWSTKLEIDHPNTPAEVKRAAARMIYTKETGLTSDEVRQLREIERTLRGGGKQENVKEDARHIFESQKYGTGFVTTDERIIKKREDLKNLLSMRIRIYKPTEFLRFLNKQIKRQPGGSAKKQDLC